MSNLKNVNVKDLKNHFDKVYIHYCKDARGSYDGVTVVSLHKGSSIYLGFSYCHSLKDSFNKRLGRTIALGRAIDVYKTYKSVTSRYSWIEDKDAQFLPRLKSLVFKTDVLDVESVYIKVAHEVPNLPSYVFD